MVLAVLADVNLVLQLVKSAKLHLDTAVAGTGHAVMHEGAEQLTAGAADAMAVHIGVLDDVVVFHGYTSPLLL